LKEIFVVRIQFSDAMIFVFPLFTLWLTATRPRCLH